MKLNYLRYDVFTTEPLLGNQLAVFGDGRGVATSLMQRIAREMNLSESTFVLPAESPGSIARVRIFTPATEMPMAGHPTIGTTFALVEMGVISRGTPRAVLGLNVGPIPVDLEWDGDSLRFVWMTQGNPVFGPLVDARNEVAETLALDESDLVGNLPVQQISCGVPYLLVPLKDRSTVDRALSDAAAFARLGKRLGQDVPAIFLFAVAPGEPESIYSRMFAPGLGVVEDPATGSAAGPLGCYLVQHGVVSGAEAQRIVNTQGVLMGRSSTIHIAITGFPDAITEVKVGGRAVLAGRGELFA